MSLFKTVWILEVINKATGPLSQMSGPFGKLTSMFSGLGGKSGFLGGMLSSLAPKFGGLALGLSSLLSPATLVSGALEGITQAAGHAITVAADYQDNLAELSAITGITGKDLDYLADRGIEVGAKTGYGAGKAIEAYKLLASNIDIMSIGGIKALDELQEKTLTLAKAAGVELPMAADTMAATINQFSFQASESARVINALAAGAKFGAAEIPDLAESLKVTGTTAALSKVSLEETIGALEILSQNAVKGGEAGTGLRNVLLALQTKGKLLPGINLPVDGLTGSLAKLEPKLNNTILLSKVFGRENINAAQLLIKNAAAVGEMTKKVTGTNTAYEQAKIRSNTYNESMKRFKATIDGLWIKMGSVLLPVVTKAINWISNGISSIVNGVKNWYNNSHLVQDIVKEIGKLFEAIWTVIGWIGDAIGWVVDHSLKPMWETVNGIYDSFKLLLNGDWKGFAHKMFDAWNPLVGIIKALEKLFGKKLLPTDADWKAIDAAADAQSGKSQKAIDATNKRMSAVENEKPSSSATTALDKSKATKDAGVDKAISDTSAGVAGKGDQVKYINVRIDSLIKALTIQTTTLKESASSVKQQVADALIGAVRDTEQAL